MRDQYSNPIPKDLILLENTDEALHRGHEVERLPWYVVGTNRSIYVSDASVTALIGSHDFLPIAEVHPFLRQGDVLLVDNPLKRWNLQDGFYHA